MSPVVGKTWGGNPEKYLFHKVEHDICIEYAAPKNSLQPLPLLCKTTNHPKGKLKKEKQKGKEKPTSMLVRGSKLPDTGAARGGERKCTLENERAQATVTVPATGGGGGVIVMSSCKTVVV